MRKFVKHTLTALLLTSASVVFAANYEPTQYVVIHNNTNQALGYHVNIYHEVYRDNPDHGVIAAHSSQTISFQYDFYMGWNRGSKDLTSVFCALYRDNENTNCSSFVIDLYPNLTSENDSVKENPMTIRFQGDTPNDNGADTMTAMGFNNSDSNYTMSYSYTGSNEVNAGVALTYNTNTSDRLGQFDIDINSPRILDENSLTPTITTTLVASSADLEQVNLAQDVNLYKVTVSNESQHGVTPPLNGFFYQVKEDSGKLEYFYPTTGFLYNRDGSISPNSFEFNLTLPVGDKSYQLSACTSDFISDPKNPDLPVCHHTIWSKVLPILQNVKPWQYNNKIQSINIAPLNPNEGIYNNGSYAFPVIVSINGGNGEPLPSTDSAYDYLFFLNGINHEIISNNVFDNNATAIIPADIAWLHGAIGEDNYAAKYTSSMIIRRPKNTGKLYYIYTTNPANLDIIVNICGLSHSARSCLLGNLATGTDFSVKQLFDDKNTIDTNNQPNPSVLRSLHLNKSPNSLAPECGNLENPNTPALNYVMSHWSLPDTAVALPDGAYYLLPGMSACALSHGLFCTDSARDTENSSTLYRFYLEDVSNGAAQPLTHANDQLWAKYLLLSDQYDYSNSLTGNYYIDQAQHDHAVLFDNCGVVSLYQLHQTTKPRDVDNGNDGYSGGAVIVYNDFSYPIILRSIDTSHEQDNLHPGTGVMIFAHHSIAMNYLSDHEHLEADSLAGIRLFDFQLDTDTSSEDYIVGDVSKLDNCTVPAYLEYFTALTRATNKLYLMPGNSNISAFDQMYKENNFAKSQHSSCNANQLNSPKKNKQTTKLATTKVSPSGVRTPLVRYYNVVLVLKNTKLNYYLQSAIYTSNDNHIMTKTPENFLSCTEGPFPIWPKNVELPQVSSIAGYKDIYVESQCFVYPNKNGKYQLVINSGDLLNYQKLSILDIPSLPSHKMVDIDGNMSIIRFS
ncbi:hypothetical protein [Cysteiniphilum litorale]|uniref:hypothetical protein n=1 Tax=Cysteiniphilum litorale TaxID=2056700 RepID=UPI003F8837B6